MIFVLKDSGLLRLCVGVLLGLAWLGGISCQVRAPDQDKENGSSQFKAKSQTDSTQDVTEEFRNADWTKQTRWGVQERKDWYLTGEGSHLIRFEVFSNIESEKENSLFSEPRNLRRFGYVFAPQQAVEWAPELSRLPLGFVKDKNKFDNQEYLGFTCAACHTGEYKFKGNHRIIEGGQVLADFGQFLIGLEKALKAHQSDAAKLARFVERMNRGGTSDEQAIAMLAESAQTLKGVLQRASSDPDGGPGRIDALTVLQNEILGEDLGVPENIVKPMAPISIPYLWDVPDLECIQTNCLARDPITRNIGQALGVFGFVNLKAGPDMFLSSVKIENLRLLEDTLKKLDSPIWDEEILGKIDSAKALRGKNLYDSQCVSCHQLPNVRVSLAEHKHGRKFMPVKRIPFEEVGTDSAFIEANVGRNAQTATLEPIISKLTKSSEPVKVFPALKATGLVTRSVKERFFKEKGISQAEILAWSDFRDDVDSAPNAAVYRARPLNGIAFTAPYLHNGSVQNLYELLLPPAKRKVTFQVGNLEYDVVNVGYINGGEFTIDTRIKGNMNSGHVWGTTLADSERFELIEFLKTL